MTERKETFPPPVEDDDADQLELPLVDDIEPQEPTPDIVEAPAAEESDRLPPIPD